jgi:hypothetical protein
MKNITLEVQMELTLASASKAAQAKKSPRRAGWWFSQMRQTVDKAIDWKPQPTPPSHQVYMALQRNGPNW